MRNKNQLAFIKRIFSIDSLWKHFEKLSRRNGKTGYIDRKGEDEETLTKFEKDCCTSAYAPKRAQF